MPIIFKDSHQCERCGKLFEWNYFELTHQNINSPQFKVEAIPHEKTLIHSYQQHDNDIYNIEVNYSHCDFDNYFKFIIN